MHESFMKTFLQIKMILSDLAYDCHNEIVTKLLRRLRSLIFHTCSRLVLPEIWIQKLRQFLRTLVYLHVAAFSPSLSPETKFPSIVSTQNWVNGLPPILKQPIIFTVSNEQHRVVHSFVRAIFVVINSFAVKLKSFQWSINGNSDRANFIQNCFHDVLVLRWNNCPRSDVDYC